MNRLLFLLVLSLMLGGCAAPPPVSPPATPSATPAASPITEKEALEFGQELSRALTESDGPALSQAVDYDRFLELVLHDVPLDPKDLAGFRKGFKSSLQQNPGGILQAMMGNRARVLRYHQVDGGPRVLIRVLIGKSPAALNYLDLHLERGKAGTVRACDFYSYTTGELISQTLRRTVLPVLAQLSKTPLERLASGSGQDASRHFQKLVELVQLVRSGQHKEAIELYGQLPNSLQQDKVVLLAYMQAGMELEDDKAYLDALERLKKAYPDDPSFQLHQVDYHYLRGELAELPKTLDALEKSLGVEDPYLDVMRASGLVEKGELDAALVHAREAAAREPDLEEAHWAVVNVSLEKKDYAAVAGGLDALRRFYPEDLKENVEGDPAYAGFVQSAEGARWLRSWSAR